MSFRLLYLASSPVPSTAANSVHVIHMCAAFVKQGLGVTLATPASSLVHDGIGSVLSDYDVEHRFAFRRLWKPRVRGGGLLYRLSLRWLLHTHKADLVYGRSLQGCRIASENGQPTVFEIHKPDWEYNARNSSEFNRLIKGKGFRAVVCISKSLEEHLVSSFPQLSGCTLVAHDGAPSLEPPEQDRKPGEGFVVGYFGSLHPGKGVETLLAIAPECTWARFRIVGGDAEAIQKWDASTEIPANIQFEGHRPHRELPALMAACDVLVAPYLKNVSVHGGGGDVASWMSPLKLFEYMAVGRPIVSADLPVLREVLEDGVNALLAEPGDTTTWIQALERLRNEPSLARKLSEQARLDYEDRYTWDARSSHIIDGLKRIGAIDR